MPAEQGQVALSFPETPEHETHFAAAPAIAGCRTTSLNNKQLENIQG